MTHRRMTISRMAFSKMSFWRITHSRTSLRRMTFNKIRSFNKITLGLVAFIVKYFYQRGFGKISWSLSLYKAECVFVGKAGSPGLALIWNNWKILHSEKFSLTHKYCTRLKSLAKKKHSSLFANGIGDDDFLTSLSREAWNTNSKGSLSTVDLLIKVACFVSK